MWSCPYETTCEIIKKKKELENKHLQSLKELLQQKRYILYFFKKHSIQDSKIELHQCNEDCIVYRDTKMEKYEKFLGSNLWKSINDNYDGKNIEDISRMIEETKVGYDGKAYRMVELSSNSKAEVEVTEESRKACVKSLLR